MAECTESTVITFLSAALLLCISFALGCTLDWVDFVRVSKTQKRGVVVGWCSQFGFMPLYTYLVALAADYDTLLAIGCILTGCAPGGTTSNLFTLWVRGNVALSIVMSAMSTLCATFMVPLCVLIYIDSTYSTDDIRIDYVSLFITLALIVIPAAIGVTLRNSAAGVRLVRGTPVWQWFEKLGSVLGLALLIAVFAFALATESEFLNKGADVWIPALLLEPLGCAVGFGLATITGLDMPSRRAVSLETGVQSTAFVIAVISLSFHDDCDSQNKALVFPYIASICWVINSLWICAAMRHYAPLQQDDQGERPSPSDGVDAEETPAKTSAPTATFQTSVI